MRNAKTVAELAGQIESNRKAKRDFIAPTRSLSAVVGAENRIEINLGEKNQFQVNEFCEKQFNTWAGIPNIYAERLKASSPGLYADNLNHWLKKDSGSRMVRTLSGQCRAFLSNRYRRLENEDLVEQILPMIAKRGLEVIRCDMTDRNLYLQAVDHSIAEHITGIGHEFKNFNSPGLIISNSEVGAGSLKIESMIYTRACTNTAIMGHSLRQYHVGRVVEDGEGIFSDRTKQLDDTAFWSKAKDVLVAAIDPEIFAKNMNKAKAAAGVEIKHPEKVVEMAAERFTLNDSEKDSVLMHLIKGGSLTQYGLSSAVTRASQDLIDTDRSVEFDRIGGAILELAKSDAMLN
jgi:hypothetical protein